MKCVGWLLGLMLFAQAMIVNAESAYALSGKFDLSPDVYPVGARNYTRGFWLAGVEKPLWHLDNAQGKRLIEIGPQYLHGLLGFNQSAALFIDSPIAGLGAGLAKILDAVKPEFLGTAQIPGWAQTLGNYVSIEAAGGYNFAPRLPQDKGFFGTIGGRLKIPWGPKTSN